MIRKTLKQLNRRVDDSPSGILHHYERVTVTTWWFLFVPIYSSERIDASTL